jgi:uncharacterized protein
VELEKTLSVAAPRPRVWELLLDPKIMAGCVPGTQSVEVISDTEYVAEIRIKISFIAARFKVKTTILEARAPDYLRIEGTGEDSSVASAMKQSSELFLTDLGDGTTVLRIKVKADVLGRLGSFGLSVMKTKADRMWEEFGANFAAVVQRGAPAPPATVAAQPAAAAAPPGKPTGARWWQRMLGPASASTTALSEPRLPTDIYVELHRPDGVIKVLWPASAAPEAARWLKEVS